MPRSVGDPVGVHILAIGRRPDGTRPNDILMDDVDAKVDRLGPLIVARCDSVDDLIKLVSYHGKNQQRVDVLDIFDHGRPGKQRLGREVLFESDGTACGPLTGGSVAGLLSKHLNDVAQVRLLGCQTATASKEKGRFLLIKLARALGGRRVVYGTIDTIDAFDFDENGFRKELEISYLYSSTAALDAPAPDRGARHANIKASTNAHCPPVVTAN